MLKIEHLDKVFKPQTPDAVHALRDVSLNVAESSFVVVIGTNGSGKSTLLNAVAGTFLPDSGTIHLAEKNITNWPEHRRAYMIGRVFQDPFKGTAPEMTIAENLAMAAKRGLFRGLGKALNKTILNEFADRIKALNMGLETRLNTPMSNLSGGQRQALTLMMATWLRPNLLLLDEHTAALDPKSADKIIHLTNKIVTRKKLTTLMVTHSMHQAASFGDRLIMMHKGEIIHDFAGAEKARLQSNDLIAHFDEVRRSEQLNRDAAEVLRAGYV